MDLSEISWIYFFSYFDQTVSKFIVGTYTAKEDAIIDNVKLCGTFPGGKSGVAAKACITLRVLVITFISLFNKWFN